MTKRDRPTSFIEAVDIARVVTDNRTEFDVYLDVARRLSQSRLIAQLSELAISDAHKKQLVEAEAYSIAQPAHLADAGSYKPDSLVRLLEEISVLNEPSE
jgi:hypothetical protein